jgi:hypothetical protein
MRIWPVNKQLSKTLCGLALLCCGCHKPQSEGGASLVDLKRLYLTAYSYAEDRKAQNSSGVVELDEIWYLLPEETQMHLLRSQFSYFPLRIGSARLCPLAIASTSSGTIVIYNDGSAKLRSIH